MAHSFGDDGRPSMSMPCESAYTGRGVADATYRDRDGLFREHLLEVVLEALLGQAVRADVVELLLFTHPFGKAGTAGVCISGGQASTRMEGGASTSGWGPASCILYPGP